MSTEVEKYSDGPEFWKGRLEYWQSIKTEQEKKARDENVSIQITLPDGSVRDGIKGITTPMDIAKSISSGLARSVIVAKVNDQLFDLFRPLEGDCTLSLLKFSDKEAEEVFWHSSSHILGQALEKHFNCLLCKGPPIESGGFYYDIFIPDEENNAGKSVKEEDYAKLESIVKNIVKDKQDFERLTLTKEQALEMFKYNKYKTEIIQEKVPDGDNCTAYRCGPLIDLCRGPHVPNTSLVKAFKVTKNSSSYWRNDASNDTLQRVYGISFPQQKELKKWVKLQEERAKRDHRLIGKDQELFFFNDFSPGSAFFLPHGAAIYNKLIELMRKEYRKRGFKEVISPNIFDKKLWQTSGHYQNYHENIFLFPCDNSESGLKPMNCPGHCVIFGHRQRSYRELPLRLAEFGVLHRNELKGALTGLTRVRRFIQDDAHIFCRKDQIKEEMKGCLDFLNHIYKIFGFSYTLELSTRPEKKYMGDLQVWNDAEKSLAEALTEFAGEDGWKENPGDGAFYGPKIDIHVKDAMEREYQCATIQLDFNLPERFDLNYTNVENEERPVIIHRAIYGSLERFIGILTEHYGGKWPFFISSRQVIVCTISPDQREYGKQLRDRLIDEGFEAELDDSDRKIAKKVREAQVEWKFNYILVVGQKEAENGTVAVRMRDNNQVRQGVSVEDIINEFHEHEKNYQ